jgi:uncharacterized damage-inducible protein DinB
MKPHILIPMLERNYRVVVHHMDGLTHADSLLQPPYRGNCMNWVFGHIINSRNNMLAMLGQPKLWGDAESQRYKRGSDPITCDEQALPLDRLRADFQTVNEQLVAALGQMTEADLETPTDDETLGEALLTLIWHETYHVGQFEQLRQLTGIGDQVVA